MKIYLDRDKVIDAIEQEFGGDTSPECIRAKEAVYSVESADVKPIIHFFNEGWGTTVTQCERNDMSDTDMYKAIKQYETFGKITPCKYCANYNYKESVKGYGVCAVFGRMMKENEFCCYGKERESGE